MSSRNHRFFCVFCFVFSLKTVLFAGSTNAMRCCVSSHSKRICDLTSRLSTLSLHRAPASSLRAVASSPPASHPLPPGRRRCGPVARSLAGPGLRGWPLNRTGPSGLRDSCRTREDKAARSGAGPSDRLRRALRTGTEPRRSTHGNGYGAGGARARPPPGGHRGTRSSAHLHGGRSIAHGCWGGVLRAGAGACGACGDG